MITEHIKHFHSIKDKLESGQFSMVQQFEVESLVSLVDKLSGQIDGEDILRREIKRLKDQYEPDADALFKRYWGWHEHDLDPTDPESMYFAAKHAFKAALEPR